MMSWNRLQVFSSLLVPKVSARPSNFFPCNSNLENKNFFSVGQQTHQNESKQKKEPTFATLFRDSPLVQLGSIEGKLAVGEIVDVVENDLFIDFGMKFNAVCKRPKQNSSFYVRGSKVKIQINDLELSDRFLGSPQDMTLLEADVTLLGLYKTSVVSQTKPANLDVGKNLKKTDEKPMKSKIEKIK